jgi:hypothetical protein
MMPVLAVGEVRMRFGSIAVLSVLFLGTGCFGMYKRGEKGATTPIEDTRQTVVLYTETAPGFELPRSEPSVLVLQNLHPSVSEQKLVFAMRQVIKNQGGVLVDDPQAAELIVSVSVEPVTETRQRVAMVEQRSRSFGVVSGPNGWALASGQEVTEVPMVLNESVALAMVAIDMFIPVREAAGASGSSIIRHVWRGTMSVRAGSFAANTRWWLNQLFQRFGGPDGRIEDRL